MSVKKELKQRLLTFEAFNGGLVMFPWGLGFIYCGLYDLKLGYQYGFISLGIVLVIWSLRKVTVNRVKQQAKIALQVDQAKEMLK